MSRLTACSLPAFLSSLVLSFACHGQAAPGTPAAEPAKPAAAPATPPATAADETVFVLMKTSQGEIVLELNKTKAPISVENFLGYVNKGFYDGTVFHRVIDGFMIQGGGFDRSMVQKETAAPIKNEWQNGLKNKRGTIAMARTNAPDSATSQFYINVVDNDALDVPRGGAAYAVFGKVIDGMETVDRIKTVPTGQKMGTTPQGSGPFPSVPLESVVIEKVTVMPKEEAEKRRKG
jgi:peptidyl-prolyl cis-trans isomerase A (cyclophilin A)/peptidyl-prolyl cis-trans isomerase B (cyclophilin B)